MPVQDVSLFNAAPGFDYAGQLSQIERSRRYADLLQQQAMEPLPTNQMAGGFVVPVSPWQGLAKVLGGWTAAKMGEDSDQQLKDLAGKAQRDYQDKSQQIIDSVRGTPASPGQYDEVGGINIPPSAAKGPDYARALSIAGTDQRLAPLGTMALGQMQKEIQRQRLSEALKQFMPQTGSASGPQALGAEATAGGAPGPTNAAAGRIGQANGGLKIDPISMAILASSDDPNAMTELAKMQETARLKGQEVTAGRAGAPMWGKDANGNNVIIGFNPKLEDGMTMSNDGTVSAVPGYATTKTALGGIPNPGAPMVKIPLSGGQEAYLTQPEYLEFQRTQQLPARFGGQPQPQPSAPSGAPQPQANGQGGMILAGGQPVPASERATAQAALDAAARGQKFVMRGDGWNQGGPGLGVPGLTQSNQDQVTQGRQLAGGKTVDEAFGKDYTSFVLGGAQDATKQLSQLQDVMTSLKDPNAGLTGSMRGYLPDWVRNTTNPQAIAMRERVEEVVQRSLRAVLGAQFTEEEGKRLIARAYNEHQPQAENQARVGRLFTQLQQALAAKTDAARYFEANGTLQGWQGRLPTMSDFDPSARTSGGAIGPGAPSNAPRAPAGVDPRLWAAMTPQERALWK